VFKRGAFGAERGRETDMTSRAYIQMERNKSSSALKAHYKV
jgi:hypothetical protein